MDERIDGFPLSYGQTIDILGFTRNHLEKICRVEMTYESRISKVAPNKYTLTGAGWSLTFLMWFEEPPEGVERFAFEGDLDRFTEDYIWLKLRQ